MLAKKNNGSILLKLGLVLVVLAVVAYFGLQRLQGTARVKAATRDKAVDAVTGTVSVDADGGTKTFVTQSGGQVKWSAALNPGARFRKDDKILELDSSELVTAREESERQFLDNKRKARFLLTGGKPELLDDGLKLSDEEKEKVVRENNPDRKLAAEKLANARRIYGLGNISKEDVSSLERTLDAIDRDLKLKLLDEKRGDSDYAAATANTNLQIKKMTIIAPDDGQVHEAMIWNGAVIGPGHTVGTWFSNTRIVAAKISEESFGKVKLGQTALVRLLTYGRQEFEATVSKLLPKADDAQRFTVFLDVKADAEQLNPGSTGEVTITVAEHPNQVMIQRRAIFDGDKVYVVKNGRVEKRKIEVGFLALNVAEVTKGIEVGDQVIVDNLDEFRDGDRVKVQVIP